MFCPQECQPKKGNTTIIDASRSIYGNNSSALGGQLKDALGGVFGKDSGGGGGGGEQKKGFGGFNLAQTGIGNLMRGPAMMPFGMGMFPRR